jgi:hypothetical protein
VNNDQSLGKLGGIRILFDNFEVNGHPFLRRGS